MANIRSVLELLASCLIYFSVIFLIDIVLILVFRPALDQVASSLPLVLLVEGGLGLIVGGAIGANSPMINKIGEVLFHSKPRDIKRQKEIERQAKSCIVTGIILVFAALLLSAVGSA